MRERGVLSLENAVHRMTGLSASKFGLRERGEIKVGNYADITVFDASSIRDRATFETPTEPAAGVVYVLVNGQMALDSGALTPARAGLVLRRAEGTARS